jgi:type IV pilus assembly protein PilB
MVILRWPTGSGKTTTLYATLTQINSEEINVMTVEDPVEYVFPVNQIQINEQAGVTSSADCALLVRPRRILVGEIRDVESAHGRPVGPHRPPGPRRSTPPTRSRP